MTAGNRARNQWRPGCAGLGATLVRVRQPPGRDHYGVAMQDPEGNEFDID